MSDGRFTINNTDSTYTGSQRITSGDKLEFKVQLEGKSSLSNRWVAVARDVNDILVDARRKRLEILATDFEFTVLSWRTVYDSFE